MNWKATDIQKLVQSFLLLRTPNEMQHFLRDLMTEKEITEMAKRLQAAEMLTEKTPYSIIEKETGLSSTTVARVARWLKGKEGGYKIIIKRLHHHNSPQSGKGLS